MKDNLSIVRLLVKCFLFLLFMAGMPIFSHAQDMGTMNEPVDGGDPVSCGDAIAVSLVSQDCLDAVISTQPLEGCSYSYSLYRNGQFVTSKYGEVVYFNVSVNGTYKATVLADGVILESNEAIVSAIETAVSKPYISGSLSREICSGGSNDISTTDSQWNVTYKLYRGTTLVTTEAGNGSSVSFGNHSTAGTYKVVAEKLSNQCKTERQESSTMTLSVISPNVSIGNVATDLCTGSMVTLTASGSSDITNYTWYDSDNVEIGTGTSIEVQVSSTNKQFKIEGRTAEYCSASDEVTINIVENTLLPEEPFYELRADRTVELYINNTNGSGYQYFWVDDPNDKSTATYPNPRLVPAGHYYVRSKTTLGCWGPAVMIEVPDFSTPVYSTGLDQNNINYIKTYTYQEEGLSPDPETLPDGQVQLSTMYYDGLGRPMQAVVRQGSPNNRDLVTPVHYDQYGRKAKAYLSYEATTSTGNVVAQPFVDQLAFYEGGAGPEVASDPYPFSMTLFEPSPLNRVAEQGAPGMAWQPSGHTVKMAYKTNQADQVIIWEYVQEGNSFGKVIASGYYDAGSLYVTQTEDENGHHVLEYKSKLGKVVLKDVRDENDIPHQTYYIYDDFGNLRMVLPPEFVKTWEEQDGIVEDPNSYSGYTSVDQSKIIYNTSENTKYYVEKGQTLTLGDGFISGTSFHATSGINPQYLISELINQYAFYYHYDGRRRMVEKHVPGGGTIYLVYDQWDRLVLTQDEEQRKEDEWLYTKYDALNRPVITGLWTDSGDRSRAALQADVMVFSNRYESRDNGLQHGYTLSSTFPATGIDANQVLKVTYYDNYDYKFLAEDTEGIYAYRQPTLTSGGARIFETSANHRLRGQVTGTLTKVLGETNWLKTATYYDDKYRAIQSINESYQGGTNRMSSAYDFTGKATHSLREHNAYKQLAIFQEFTYDHMGRPEDTWQTVAEGGESALATAEKVLVSRNEYNALGELIDKKLHSADGQNFEQSVDYRYNIRGWLTHINNSGLGQDDNNDDTGDLYGMELGYIDDFGLGTVETNYNGNITAIKWSANLGLDPDENERANVYNYDGLNRLLSADYGIKGTQWDMATDSYGVNGLTYDANGNILALDRNDGTGAYLDDLTYQYMGNRLTSVTDQQGDKTKGFKDGNVTGNDYSYYDNGNLKEDKNKGITNIAYNHLNLPGEITFDTGGKINYIYDAVGNKLSKLVTEPDNSTKLRDYMGGIIYKDGQLQFLQHAEGRIVYNPGESVPFEYQYHLKDHLGNVRVTFTSKEETDQQTATSETAHEQEERAAFLYYDEVTKINSTLFDHTGETGSNYSVRLSGAEGEKIGLARSLAVMPGDVVSAEVFAKYLDPDQNNWTTALADLMAAIASGSPAVVIEGTGVSQQSFGFGSLLDKSSDTESVKAYLNVLVFDKDFDLVDGGYYPVGQGAKEDGSNVPHLPITSKVFDINEPGFVYVYLSNDGSTPVEAFFDDFTVTHQQGKVVQMDDYYPFGLTFNAYFREGELGNDFLFQGQERQDELGLGWVSFKWRNHDPTIGRFFNIDPLASDYVYNSPYAFSENHVTSHVELEGLEKISIHSASFAPFDKFGGNYKGDGAYRTFGTNSNSSSRIRGTSYLNVTGNGVTRTQPSEPKGSISHNLKTGESTYSEARMRTTLSNSQGDGTKASANFGFHISGNNDLVPDSWDIDSKGNLSISTVQGENGSTITFSGEISGDGFPANETFISDVNGTGVMLGASGADGNPYTTLAGNNNRTMSEFNLNINFNKAGEIQSVMYNGTSYSVEDWNKQFTQQDPQSDVKTTYR